MKKLTIYICMLHDGSYTWKIYANKVLNMGSTYGFWRTLNKEESSQTALPTDVLQSSVQELGRFRICIG
jgi:hypothetical protein